MLARWGVALALLVHAPASLAQADLQLTSLPSRTTGLWLADEVLLTTTVRNNGPGPAAPGTVSFSGDIEDFTFDVVSSETPACDLEALDFQPPRQNFMWAYPSLPEGTELTCVVRLSVFSLPASGPSQLRGRIEPLNDPVAANNRVVLDFSFGSAVITHPHAIPAASSAAIALCIAGMMVVAWLGAGRTGAPA